MAVVFISPKQRQKMFFTVITVIMALFLVAVSLGVFLSKPKDVPVAMVFNKPKINIDTKIFDSEQFKNLEAFSQMQIQYSYKAETKAGKKEAGLISASSRQEASDSLTSKGLTITELKEIEAGRINPFDPYY